MAMQSLLFRNPVVQDNFLLSGGMQRLEQTDSLVSGLIRVGALAVALRDSSTGLTQLNDQIVKKARKGSYVPFIGDSINLYDSRGFRDYLGHLDGALDSGSHVVKWVPQELGSLFRDKMQVSASNGEWGGKVEDLSEVYDWVDAMALSEGRETHSCSDYFAIADKRLSGARKSLVKNWARSYYLTNLPDRADISAWLPAHPLRNHRLSGAISKLPRVKKMRSVLSNGLLNPHFLANVTAEAIHDVRKDDRFIKLQTAFETGTATEREYELGQYAKMIADNAPKLMAGSRETIESAERRATKYQASGKNAAILGAGIGAVSAASAAHLVQLTLDLSSPRVTAAIAAGGAMLGRKIGQLGEQHMNSKAERALAGKVEAIDAAKKRLHLASRWDKDVLSLVDVIHWSPLKS